MHVWYYIGFAEIAPSHHGFAKAMCMFDHGRGTEMMTIVILQKLQSVAFTKSRWLTVISTYPP